MAKAPHYYSGDKSARFWKRINGLASEIDRRRLYSLGVLLQNLEEHVLREVLSAELREREQKKAKRK